MKIWTTYCPQKVAWELTYRKTNGDLPTGDWQKHKSIIRDSLILLKDHGISGIRLVIFPYEVTDGTTCDFSPVEYMLELCQSIGLEVDFCIGPFQYPHYPGVRLPYPLTQKIANIHPVIDADVFFWKFGMEWLDLQLKRYGKDTRIRGFYLGNEWPDAQRIERREHVITTISESFMMQAVLILKDMTDKPIFFNTNIDASFTRKVRGIFSEFFAELGKQSRLGWDVYPSQEDWKVRLLHKVFPWDKAVTSLTSLISRDQMLFTELEGQPWGGGKAWEYYIKRELDPQYKVLQYSQHSLPDSWKRYVIPSKIKEVNIWGSDFWLVAFAAGITWPLEQIKAYAKE